MTTILIWLGVGFAFGIGLIVGCALIPAITAKSRDESNQLTRDSLEELRARNVIGERQAAALEMMVSLMRQNSK